MGASKGRHLTKPVASTRTKSLTKPNSVYRNITNCMVLLYMAAHRMSHQEHVYVLHIMLTFLKHLNSEVSARIDGHVFGLLKQKSQALQWDRLVQIISISILKHGRCQTSVNGGVWPDFISSTHCVACFKLFSSLSDTEVRTANVWRYKRHKSTGAPNMSCIVEWRI